MEDLATVAEPLCALQQKGAAFVWSEECQGAFEKIKEKISGNLKLALYNPNAETHLNTDAFGVGISAVLSQKQNGTEVIVACQLHVLQQEAYAIVWGTEAFEKFLWGWPFVIHTDHRVLQFFFQGPAKAEHTHWSSKLIRWAERLSTFNYSVEHVKDSQMGSAAYPYQVLSPPCLS